MLGDLPPAVICIHLYLPTVCITKTSNHLTSFWSAKKIIEIFHKFAFFSSSQITSSLILKLFTQILFFVLAHCFRILLIFAMLPAPLFSGYS